MSLPRIRRNVELAAPLIGGTITLMSGIIFHVTATPAAEDVAVIHDGLVSFNMGDTGPSGRMPLAVIMRDSAHQTIGGLTGYTAWSWLYIDRVFVPATVRGQGLATMLLRHAEEEAARRGCHGAWLDTFNPDAQRAYERAGYAVFGTLPDCPPGRTRAFLRKVFAPS